MMFSGLALPNGEEANTLTPPPPSKPALTMTTSTDSMLHQPEPLELAAQSMNSPRISKRNRGGSFSGLADCNGDMGPNSPSLRRRRSRIPSEEDGKLMNFLVSSGRADDSRERNLSVGNLGKPNNMSHMTKVHTFCVTYSCQVNTYLHMFSYHC